MPLPLAGTEEAGGGCRRCIGEKNAQTNERREDRGGESEARERNGTKVANHGGVHGDEQGLSEKRTERRKGEATDVAVDGVLVLFGVVLAHLTSLVVRFGSERSGPSQ